MALEERNGEILIYLNWYHLLSSLLSKLLLHLRPPEKPRANLLLTTVCRARHVYSLWFYPSLHYSIMSYRGYRNEGLTSQSGIYRCIHSLPLCICRGRRGIQPSLAYPSRSSHELVVLIQTFVSFCRLPPHGRLLVQARCLQLRRQLHCPPLSGAILRHWTQKHRWAGLLRQDASLW